MQLPLFNVTKSALCTCLPKFNINPYLGRCAHGCVYCYAVKFPSFRGPTIPRLKIKNDIIQMVETTKNRWPVMLSDSTDPYQPLEKEYEITRSCLYALTEKKFPILVVTKSNLVTRDIDLLRKTETVVSMTITTLREETAKTIEPHAPLPNSRFEALEQIADEGIPTVVRIDPIIPLVNWNIDELEKIVCHSADIGVKQITASTMKLVKGVFGSLKNENPRLFNTLQSSYSDGEWICGYKYLNREKRFKILSELKSIVAKHGLKFATCREGFPQLNNNICDGSAYCRTSLNEFA
ncbi:radical SAM protein [Candidatus Bathyarchaeota archaeon]|nr:radical SAM protein [Candidatus Bathyarchaeota archaeon]